MLEITDDNRLGKMIRAARQAKDMTQEELAEKVGVTKAVISKYENGTVKNLSRPRIQALANALDLSPLAFLDVPGWSATYTIPGTGEVRFTPKTIVDISGSMLKADSDTPEDLADMPGLSRALQMYLTRQARAEAQGPRGCTYSDEEQELLRIYKLLPVKGRLQLLNLAYKLEEENAVNTQTPTAEPSD